MHPRLLQKLLGQAGVFSFADALACRYTRGDVRAMVRSGRWRVLGHGTYTTQELWEAADTRVAQHRLELAARLLRCGPRTVAGHRSAAVAHHLPVLGAPPKVPVLTREGAPSESRFVKVAELPDTERTVVGAIRTSSLDRTVVDISRRSTFRASVVTADGALRQGLDPVVLMATSQRWSHWPYGRRPVDVAAFADGRAESPLESLGRVALHEQGVEPPELQVEVWLGGVLLARVDHLWEQYAVIGEADGMGKYDDGGALREEKRRQEMLEQVGFGVVRYDWEDAYRRQVQLAARVRAAFSRGRPDLLDPRVRLVRTQTRVIPRAA
jgi:hypothetical protein